MKNKPGIAFYITSRLLALFAIFVVGYSYIANHLYLWGMDEATVFYMSAEADIVLEQYQQGDDIEEHIDGFREYYWPDSLPNKYQQQFNPLDNDLNRLFLHQAQDSVIYMMPLGENSLELYVVHILPNVSAADESTEPVRKMLIQIALVTLLGVVIIAVWFVYRLVSAVMSLSQWASKLSAEDDNSLTIPPQSMPFKELEFLAQRLSESFVTLAKFNEREQQFLRSLSHELRTPIAVTGAALDVLDKKAPESMTKLLARIRRASNTMRSLTETILWLWREPEGEKQGQIVLLHKVVEQALNDNQHLLKSKQVEVDNQIAQGSSFEIDETLLLIVCNNLIRNAFQHCDEGKVSIIDDSNSLTVINPVGEQDSVTAGFGLGLLIVQRIVDNYGWQLEVKSQDDVFAITVSFV